MLYSEDFYKNFHDLKNRGQELCVGMDILKSMLKDGEDPKELMEKIDISVQELCKKWNELRNRVKK
ncbi:MAG: hypothetical protein A2X86_03035 [Bdellovibrionales bacterium GWA2_49_15]|nr:MAG: hypothetical protein A2X86_03035 [Bdellovibrionales bacterium GWA2_49_15]HAZ14085.1 hypothetical protein [Bdellovibrionales bacterium]